MNQWHQKYREFVKALNPSEKEINEFISASDKNNCGSDWGRKFNRNLSEIQKIALLSVISKDPKLSLIYASNIKSRWKQGENSIKSNLDCAYRYARDVIEGRWIEAEEFIKTDPEYAYYYARDVIEGRWIEAEEFIINEGNVNRIYNYAQDVVKCRWKEAEHIISKDLHYAWKYVANILKGRWEEGESIFASNPEFLFKYATEILNDALPPELEAAYTLHE